MIKSFLSLIFTNFMMLNCATDLDLPVDQVAEGEQYYVDLERKAQSYGGCWKDAMSNLHTGCKDLTEDVQSRLALSFANCFLEHAGFDPCACTDDDLISDCFRNCSDRVFSSYSQFFTHTQSVCHYLQHREWQVEIARTALLLTKNSQKISQKLEESAQSQSKILDLQQAALTEQKKSITNGQILNAELVRSRENARDLFSEFKATTSEQRLLLFEIFDRMKNLQNFVLGEFTGVYTAAYYLVIAVLVYILTSVPRTADARIWLILTFSVNAASEKFLTSYTLQGSVDVNPVMISELLHERIWLCRKMATLMGLIILAVCYYRYKDYNVINNELLRQIQQQNVELQNFIKGLTLRENLMQTSVDQSLLLEDKKLIINTEKAKMKESSSPNTAANTVASNSKDLENKENSLTSSDLAASSHNLKVTPKRRNTAAKKTSQAKHQEKHNRTPLIEGHILANLESPNSPSGKKYNLRSSSRMNSPLSPTLR